MRWAVALIAGLLVSRTVAGVEPASAAPARSAKFETTAKAKAKARAKAKAKAKPKAKTAWKAARRFERKAAPGAAGHAGVRFLGLDPHGPLARVEGGAPTEPEAGACRTWGRRGQRWQALDSFGKIVGEAAITGMDRYDVTNCDELSLTRKSGRAGAGIFVSGDYRAADIDAWKLDKAQRIALASILAKRDAKVPPAAWEPKVDLPVEARMLAYTTPAGDRFVVVGGRALSVLRFDGDAFDVVFSLSPSASELAHRDMFIPVAVLDMNADGLPEIVVHQKDMDAYSDFTLTPQGSGFRQMDAGIHGAFA